MTLVQTSVVVGLRVFIHADQSCFHSQETTGTVTALYARGVEVRVDDGGPTRVFPRDAVTPMVSATGLPVMGGSLPTQGSAAPSKDAEVKLQQGCLMKAGVDEDRLEAIERDLQEKLADAKGLVCALQEQITAQKRVRAGLWTEAGRVAKLGICWAAGVAELRSRAGEFAQVFVVKG
jgi:hypothetical protein